MPGKNPRKEAEKAGLSIESYLARCKTTNERTKANYRRVLEDAERFIGKALAKATEEDLERLKTERLVADLKPSSAYVAANWLRSFYRKAGRSDLADILRLQKHKRRLGPDDILYADEVRGLIDACDNLRDRGLVVTLWNTGVRVSEALSLTLKDVKEKPANGGPRSFVLWFGTVKESGEEHLGFVVEAAEALGEWLANYPFSWNDKAPVFPSFSGRFLTKTDGWRIIQKISRRAKLTKHISPHTFRHSRATDLLRRGVSEAKVKKLLGWAPGSNMLSTYSHLVSEDVYGDLLRINGHPVPAADYERLTVSREDLKPLQPVVARPGALAPGSGLTERITKVFTELLTNVDEETRSKLLKELTA